MKTCPTCQKTYPDDFSLCPRDGAPLTAQATETEAQLAAGLSRRFRIIRQLGKGGMGTVFLAEQIGVGNRPVALKVLSRKLLDDPDFLQRFQNEAASTGRIHHPNVVTIHESGQGDDGTPYIAMELLDGESLREALKQRGALPVPEVVEILQQAARGLNAAHKLGIIHRDLKPDNIFLTQGYDEPVAPVSPAANVQVKIVDFGIAKLRESATHTMTGTVLGTPAYMSYEQASGMRSDELDARSDIYSLGVVVYEMLTGRTPFHSDTPVGYLRKHLMEEPPPFRAVKPGLPVPPQIESVVMKALTKDRNQRYGSVLEFAQEFAQAADAGSQHAAQSEPHREAAKPQPQTTVTSVAKTIVPATVGNTVAAKAVPEIAHPLRRKWLGSRWKRIGIIVSIVWILGAGIYTLKVTNDENVQFGAAMIKACVDAGTGQEPVYEKCQKLGDDLVADRLPDERITAALVAFVPVLLVWGIVYSVLFLVRWVSRPPDAAKPPQFRTISKPPGKMKFLVIAVITLILVGGGVWYFSQHAEKNPNPDGLIKKGDVSSSAEPLPSKPAITFSPFALERTLSGNRGEIETIAFSPDGKLLASGSTYDPLLLGLSKSANTETEMAIKLWDVPSGTLRQTLADQKGHGFLRAVAFSPDGRLLASGSDTIKLWDVPSGTLRQTLSRYHGQVLSAAFSPDGKMLASGSADQWGKFGIVNLWGTASGVLRKTLTLSTGKPPLGFVGSVPVAFSPDGRLLALSTGDGTVKLWDVATGTLRQTLTGSTEYIASVAFSPDGILLASAGTDGTVKLWDVSSGEVTQTLTGHSKGVEAVAFSPDGMLLASVSDDKTIKLWDVASGNLRQTLAGHDDIVFSVAFSRDGRILASGSVDKTIKLWQRKENITGSIGQ